MSDQKPITIDLSQGIKKIFIIILFGMIGIMCIAIWIYTLNIDINNNVKLLDKQETIIERPVYIDRMEFNEIVEDYIKKGKGEEIYTFFDRYTKNRDVTLQIIVNVLSRQIPIILTFSLVDWESQFVINAISKENKNGSFDVGLFQLSTSSYPQYTIDQLLQYKTNIKLGTEHFEKEYLKYNKNATFSLIAYNSGDLINIPESTQQHSNRVLGKEIKMAKAFIEYLYL